MSEDIEAQQRAFQRLGVRLYQLLGNGGTHILCTASSVGPRVQASAEVVADGVRTGVPTDDSVLEAVTSLRQACSRPGQGTWFPMRTEITSAGAASVRYEWDHEPELPWRTRRPGCGSGSCIRPTPSTRPTG